MSNSQIETFALKKWDCAVIRRILCIVQIAILSMLILATHCANHQDVFIAGNIYFTDVIVTRE